MSLILRGHVVGYGGRRSLRRIQLNITKPASQDLMDRGERVTDGLHTTKYTYAEPLPTIGRCITSLKRYVDGEFVRW